MKNIQKDIHTIDAEGKAVGRLATQIVRLLIGKHKPDFENHIDSGDHVQVINASKMSIHQGRLTQKVYRRHTTYASGLKEETLQEVLNRDPAEVLRRAVSRMLPKNKHRSERQNRLVVKN